MPPEEVVLCCGAVVWYCDECDGLGGAEPAARVRHLDQRFAAMLPDTIRVVPERNEPLTRLQTPNLKKIVNHNSYQYVQ